MVRHRPAATHKAVVARKSGAWVIALFVSLLPLYAAADVYVETVIDPSGQLHITTKHRREIVPKKDRGQASFKEVQISPDGRAVGWLAMYNDSGAADPLPLKLVILLNGEQQPYTGTGLPILNWCFWAGGREVAFKQGGLHGEMGLHYELHDVATGQLSDKYDPDANPDSVTKPPRWVVVLDSRE